MISIRPRLLAFSAAVAGVVLCGGCATPGPTHAYLASRADAPILDVLPGAANAEVATYLSSFNELYGIAYDPFTDHLFLRVFPGDFIRVIDRPAGKIKRSFQVTGLPAGPGDLAIRSRDRHLFFAHPNEPAVIETTLYGRIIRTITLDSLSGAPEGVAYDQTHNRLLILQSGDLSHVGTYDLTGQRLSGIALDRNVRLGSLAYDSKAAELYVPLLDENSVGIFSSQGALLRTIPSPSADTPRFIDVGQRSLLRLF